MTMENCLPEANVVTVRLGLVKSVVTENGYITLDNKFQKFFCISDEYAINLFVCLYEARKGT